MKAFWSGVCHETPIVGIVVGRANEERNNEEGDGEERNSER